MKRLIQTKNIGRKFNDDGSVKFFQGNTIISKVHSDNSVYPIILRISNAFQNAKGKDKYAFLPFGSFHMTMIQGVCDVDRKEELWSKYLELDTRLVEVDQFFEEKYKSVNQLPETQMRFDFIDITNHTILVRFQPKTENCAKQLKQFRDEVSEKLGLHFPDHDAYGFHISVAYQLWEMEENELKEIEDICKKLQGELEKMNFIFTLNQPEMTYFYNMFHFHSERIERNEDVL